MAGIAPEVSATTVCNLHVCATAVVSADYQDNRWPAPNTRTIGCSWQGGTVGVSGGSAFGTGPLEGCTGSCDFVAGEQCGDSASHVYLNSGCGDVVVQTASATSIVTAYATESADACDADAALCMVETTLEPAQDCDGGVGIPQVPDCESLEAFNSRYVDPCDPTVPSCQDLDLCDVPTCEELVKDDDLCSGGVPSCEELVRGDLCDGQVCPPEQNLGSTAPADPAPFVGGPLDALWARSLIVPCGIEPCPNAASALVLDICNAEVPSCNDDGTVEKLCRSIN